VAERKERGIMNRKKKGAKMGQYQKAPGFTGMESSVVRRRLSSIRRNGYINV